MIFVLLSKAAAATYSRRSRRLSALLDDFYGAFSRRLRAYSFSPAGSWASCFFAIFRYRATPPLFRHSCDTSFQLQRPFPHLYCLLPWPFLAIRLERVAAFSHAPTLFHMLPPLLIISFYRLTMSFLPYAAVAYFLWLSPPSLRAAPAPRFQPRCYCHITIMRATHFSLGPWQHTHDARAKHTFIFSIDY